MSNRYLYRAKRTDNGEWVEGYHINDVCGCFIMPEDYISERQVKNKNYGYELILIKAFEVDPYTICQCTGRNDEWEHDIFQCDDERYEIMFCEDSLTWEAVSIFSSESIELGEFIPSKYVRLGNSIDNPELLEVGE